MNKRVFANHNGGRARFLWIFSILCLLFSGPLYAKERVRTSTLDAENMRRLEQLVYRRALDALVKRNEIGLERMKELLEKANGKKELSLSKESLGKEREAILKQMEISNRELKIPLLDETFKNDLAKKLEILKLGNEERPNFDLSMIVKHEDRQEEDRQATLEKIKATYAEYERFLKDQGMNNEGPLKKQLNELTEQMKDMTNRQVNEFAKGTRILKENLKKIEMVKPLDSLAAFAEVLNAHELAAFAIKVRELENLSVEEQLEKVSDLLKGITNESQRKALERVWILHRLKEGSKFDLKELPFLQELARRLDIETKDENVNSLALKIKDKFKDNKSFEYYLREEKLVNYLELLLKKILLEKRATQEFIDQSLKCLGLGNKVPALGGRLCARMGCQNPNASPHRNQLGSGTHGASVNVVPD